MKTRRRNLSDDRQAIFQRITRSKKNSVDGGDTPLPIPIDLNFEIFSRLPPKSIAKCRCVSKLWASTLRRPDFTDLFLSKSSTRPQLLFSCVKDSELFLYSSPQVQNPDENSYVVATNCSMKFPLEYIYGTVHGLVYLNQLVIYNPSTGQSIPLPRLKTRRTFLTSFLGYHPVDKLYKVLSLTSTSTGDSKKHRVLTLGTKKRNVESFPHFPARSGICINGVLYYLAILDGPPRCCAVVCFDVRSEKYSFINKNEDMALFKESTLVNYNGKLGALLTGGTDELTKESMGFELWVLVDAEKHEWSKHVYALPDSWKDAIGDAMPYFETEVKLDFVGLTCSNEVVLSKHYILDPFYVFYYSLERKTIKRVEIKGVDASKDSRVRIFLNHVEDVKFMQVF